MNESASSGGRGPRDPVLWLDLTTSSRARGAPSGTLRVEQSYAAALRSVLGGRLRFCRFDRARGRFLALADLPDAAKPSSAARRPAKSGGVGVERKASLGRRAERAVRRWRNRALAAVRGVGGGATFPEAEAGDMVLFAGETWGQHDFALLARMRRERRLRFAAVCQDLIPLVHPQFFAEQDFVVRFQKYFDFLVNDVDVVVAISHATKADFLRLAAVRGGARGRVEVVQLGADFDLSTAPAPVAEATRLQPGNFVLSVSTIQSRKNVDLLYHLWQRMSVERVPGLPTLVIVGQQGFGSGDLLWQIAHDPAVRDTVLVLHRVSDAELTWLYRLCRFTLYPSFYEGWGLPVSESLAHGKVCIASNTSSLPEAGQGLALHLDPLDFAAWHNAIVELIMSPQLLAERERQIRESFTPTTWQQSAKRLSELLLRPAENVTASH